MSAGTPSLVTAEIAIAGRSWSDGLPLDLRPLIPGLLQVYLGQDHKLRTLGQVGAVLGQLMINGIELFPGILLGESIDQMQQQARSLDVAQELVPESHALRRALNQTGNIGNDKAAEVIAASRISYHRDPQIGHQRGKRIVAYLGPCLRNHREQCGFTGIWVSDQPNVRDQLELQLQFKLFAGLSTLRFARRLVRGGGKMYVSQAAASTSSHHDALARVQEIGNQRALRGVAHQGTRGHAKDQIPPLRAVHFLGTAIAAGPGFVVGMIVKIHQGVEAGIGLQIDGAPTSTVAAVGAAHGDVFGAMEVFGAVAAVTSGDVNLGPVVELHSRLSLSTLSPSPGGVSPGRNGIWWAQQGSNLRPGGYEPLALPLSYGPGYGTMTSSTGSCPHESSLSHCSDGCY